MLAVLAGKLMTNDFVYGAFIHMDIYLWKIRNIIKNFANFALTWLVLYSIIKGIIGKEALDVKKVITKTLIAGILIQASWFLMGAVVDISTVATASIWAFPMSFFKNDLKLQTAINNGIDGFKVQRLFVDFYATGVNDMISVKKEELAINNANREDILPNQNSVSWPFIYLGMSVFKFQNYLDTEYNTDLAPLTLWFALRFFLLFLFTVGLLLLLIANIMRVWLLRIFIIWAPFLILSQVFDVGKWWSSWLGKIFNVGNLIAIAFKPVIFVAGMSLMLIVIVSMQNSITWSGASRENNLNGVSLSKSGDTTSVLSIDWISNIAIDQKDILGKDVIGKDALGQTQNFFSHIIMLLLTIFLMRQFIKLSLTIGGWPIEDVMKKLIQDVEGMAKTMPLLPWWVGISWASSIMNKNRDKLLGWFGLNQSGNFGEMEGKNFTTNEQKFDDFIGERFFGEYPSWKNSDIKELESIAETKNSDNFFLRSQELAKSRNWWISVNTPGRIKAFEILLSKTPIAWFKWDLPVDATSEQIENYFKANEWSNAKALYEKLWGYAASKRNAPTTYDALKNISFHVSKQ